MQAGLMPLSGRPDCLCCLWPQIILHLVHKYQARYHVVLTSMHAYTLPWSTVAVFTFLEENFVAVTAYHNSKVTFLISYFCHSIHFLLCTQRRNISQCRMFISREREMGKVWTLNTIKLECVQFKLI